MLKSGMRETIKKSVVRIAPTHIDLAIRTINGMIEKGRTISILDIGGGSGEYWVKNEKLRSLLENQNIKVTIFDALIPISSRDSLLAYVQGEAPKDLVNLEDMSFDFVVAFDVIEHVSSENGFLMLYAMERISKLGAMIFTPNGFVYQRPEPGNPFNAHISGWEPDVFKKFGWTGVRGHSGFKVLFGIYGLPKYRSRIKHINYLWVAFLLFSQILVFRIPKYSYAISAFYVKRYDEIVNLSRINQMASDD